MHARLEAMACGGVRKVIVSFSVLLVYAVAAHGQDGPRQQFSLQQPIEVGLSQDGRLVLHTDESSYELAGLRVPQQCEGDAGPWACGSAARQILQGAVRGEKLHCTVFAGGVEERPAVECMAQTRNLNLWMAQRPSVEVPDEWRRREGFSRYVDADREGRETRELARALAKSDPFKIASRADSSADRAFADEPRIERVRSALELSTQTARRGATADERRLISGGLVELDRAGVWEIDGLRVIVAEGLGGCFQYIWCRFGVVDREGAVLHLGTARGAPRVVPAVRLTLTWENRRGDLRTWPD